ncbi:hypothetical protein GCM10023063_15190 [Arthrobacter methylotrophus]|uniref:Uncharacterized protein n=1 Tax=Arthrobacter methylotrophus TaxID=121291 RepID=A0ABV5URF8_9MICC
MDKAHDDSRESQQDRSTPNDLKRLAGQWHLPNIHPPDNVSADGYIDPLPGWPTTGFSAHTGEVIAHVRVFNIFWGRDYGHPNTGITTAARDLDNFTTIVVNSSYMDHLNEYGVQRGVSLGSTWIDRQPGAKTYSEDDMGALLVQWLDAGIAPEVPGPDDYSHLYFIYPSADVNLTLGGKPGGFCGYHSYGYYNQWWPQKNNLFFGVMCYPASPNVISHELAEACTDRSLNAWYTTDGKGAEIGDVCDSCGGPPLGFGPWQVGSYWLDSKSRCLQEDDLFPPPRLNVALNPRRVPLGRPVDVTITITDARGGWPVKSSAVIHNFTPRPGGYPVDQPVPGVGSPLRTTETFYAGKENTDRLPPPPVYDVAPSVTVQAPGYPPESASFLL